MNDTQENPISRLLRVTLVPLFYTLLGLTPWALFAKFVLKLPLESIPHFPILLSIIFFAAWIAAIIGFLISKMPEGQKQRALYKFFMTYGKGMALIVSVQAAVILLLLLWGLTTIL